MTIIDIKLSEDQREGTKAVINQWLYKQGDFVEKNQPLLELETDKVMMEVVAPSTGELSKIILKSGDNVTDESIIGKIDDSKGNNTKTEIAPLEAKRFIETASDDKDKNITNNHISPAVRKLITKNDININTIVGTGKNNRISKRDILKYLKNPGKSNKQTSSHISISRMRSSIAEHMVNSLLHTAPHVTSVFNLDMSAIINHRKKNKANFEKQGANLTFTAYFIAASVAGIKKVPLINSQLHKESIEIFNSINIGIGTSLNDEGLIVPVLKNCENHDLFATANALTKMTNKARMNKLKHTDTKGGTFTISNHGVSGSLIATPIIINQPQSAILGIGKMEKRVVVKELDGNDVLAIKPMCYVSLTIDHRVLDAHQCNQFLSSFVETLESWK